MRISARTTTWEPGVIYAHGHEPTPITYEGEVAGVYWDRNYRKPMFVIWDAETNRFQSVAVADSRLIPEKTA